MCGVVHSQFGGAIHNGGTLEMYSCSLMANRALMVRRCRPNLVHAPRMLFPHTKASTRMLLQMGGAIHTYEGRMMMHECIFTHNGESSDEGLAMGMGTVRVPNARTIRWLLLSVCITSRVRTDTSAPVTARKRRGWQVQIGGAIVIFGGIMEMHACIFTSNSAYDVRDCRPTCAASPSHLSAPAPVGPHRAPVTAGPIVLRARIAPTVHL